MQQASSAIVEDGPSEGEPPDEPPEKHSSVFGKIPSLLKSSFAPKISKKIETEDLVSRNEPDASGVPTPKTIASLKFLSSISLDFSGHFSSLRRKSTAVQEDRVPAVRTSEPTPTAPIPCSKSIETKTTDSNTNSLEEASVRSIAACSKSYEASFKFLSSISLADEGARARAEESERSARIQSATNLSKQDNADSEADTLTDNTLLADRFACDSPNEHDRGSSSLSTALGSEGVQRKRIMSPLTPLDVSNKHGPPSTGLPSPAIDARQQQQSLDFLKSITFASGPSPRVPLSGPPGPLSSTSATHVPSHLSWTRRELFGNSTTSLASVEGFWADGLTTRKLPQGYVLVREREGRRHLNNSALGSCTPEEARQIAERERARERGTRSGGMDAEAAGAQEEREGEGASAVQGQGLVGWSPAGGQGMLGSGSSLPEEPPPRAVHAALRAEGGLGATHLQDSTLFVCPRGPRGLRPPMAIFSVIKHRLEEENDTSEVVHSVGTQRLVREGSYAGLLSKVAASGESGWDKEKGGWKIPTRYDPLFLDDPEIRIAKDRTVIKQEGYVVTCIPFVKPKLMKEELNQLFLAKHGDWLEGSEITLSKIRTLKTTIVEVVSALDLELATAALAHVLLEKLILRNLVKKSTRKVTAGVCLLLAFKMNELPRCTTIEAMQQGLERQQEYDSSSTRHYLLASFSDRHTAEAARNKINCHFFGPEKRLKAVADFLPDLKGPRRQAGRMCSVSDLLQEMQTKLGIDRTAVLTQEFPTFVDLEMGLHVEAEELLPHLHRILASLDLTPSAYLGQDSESLAEAESCSLQAAIAEEDYDKAIAEEDEDYEEEDEDQ